MSVDVSIPVVLTGALLAKYAIITALLPVAITVEIADSVKNVFVGGDRASFEDAINNGRICAEKNYPKLVKEANQLFANGTFLSIKTSVDPNENHSLAYYEKKLNEGKAGGKRRTRKANKAKKRSTKKAKKSAKRKARKSRR